MTEIEVFRHTALVDPHLHIWGWEIPTYLFLGGVTAGLMILTAAIGRFIPEERRSRAMRLMPFAAPIVLSIGMFALLLDLAYKAHVFRFYLAFRITSPMSWGSWILLLIYPATIVLGLARLRDDEFDAVARFRPVARFGLGRYLRTLREIAIESVHGIESANIVLGIGLGAYTGVLLGTLGARALWGSLLLGPLFLVSGLSTGAAFALLFRVGHEEHDLLRRWDIAAIVVELALIALFFIDLTTGGASGRAAASMFLGGSWTAVFWAIVVIAGLLVPLALEVFEGSRRLAPTLVAPAMLLVGGFALRWILVAAGQAM